MSANRSVQAAQRRRAGAPDAGVPGRGPQPSINSAQMFANQARAGPGPNIPNGRLAGQHAAMQQQQQQQQGQKEGLSSVTKMSVPQAITLITLRLGIIESKLQNWTGNELTSSDGLDPSVFESIMSRLDALETRPTSSASSNSGASNTEINLLKQQFETVKQAVIQVKGSSTNLVKENISLKTQIDNMRKELTETKELLAALQNLTMDNSQKILDLSMGQEHDLSMTNVYDTFVNDGLEDISSDEFVGTDLKQLIENELNSETEPLNT